MNIGLFISIAANVAAILVILALLVERSAWRDLLADEREEHADARKALKAADDLNDEMFAELTEFRAAKAKRLANLSRGTPKSKIAA